MIKIKNYINGEFLNPISNDWIDNFNPSNGEVYSKIPNSNQEDVELAYEAANLAFIKWSNTSLEERHKILSNIS